MRVLRRLLILSLVAAVFCTPLFLYLGVADQENDEALYSFAAESLVRTGDWMSPRMFPDSDVVFVEKPPLKFWIVALSIRLGLLPDNDFGLRVWDALFGSVAFLYVFAFGRRMAGWLCGATALLVLFTFEPLLVQHGLRGNNMEAALVLAYAGGVYHVFRWAEAKSAAHAWAVGLYFVLGFMTKFVAALFLPAIMVAALALPAVRANARTCWRTWAFVATAAAALIAPWFVYQSLQPGRGVWTVIFSEHVVQRFTSSLDPAHVKPWDFYFRSLFDELRGRGTLWVVLAGAVLVHVRASRERWLPGTLLACWFWIPFVLMSLGTSKLWHYAYPFLAPVALVAGYLVASVTSALADRARADRPSLSRLQWIGLVGAVTFLALGGLGLVHAGRFRLLGVLIRPQPAVRAGAISIVLGLLAQRGAWVARIAVPMILLSFMSVPQALEQVGRMRSAGHPIRTTRDCIAEVRQGERVAGRPVEDLLVSLPEGYLHPFFYYFRTVGWDRRDEMDVGGLTQALADREHVRPVLTTEARFLAATQGPDAPARRDVPYVRVSGLAVVVTQGPYEKCAGRF